MKKWKTINKSQKSKVKSQKVTIQEIIKILLENRGLEIKKEIDEFLNPRLDHVTIDSVGIDKTQLKKAVSRIQAAIENDETIVIYGDYDVDGICGTAILWETIYSVYKNVFPYIPHRIDEGYGLSIRGIDNIKDQKSKIKNVKLLITVDNGIVAHEAVKYANQQGIDVIITDHHVPSKTLPSSHAIVHTTKLCGAGVAYLLAQEVKSQKLKVKSNNEEDDHLELVALATVADLVPLVGANRTLLVFGLEKLRKTQRVGLRELCIEAGIDPKNIGVYEIGHVIAPRLNASGRLEYAMDSLRLLCTKDKNRAILLAQQLGRINRERQQLTEETVLHARSGIRNHPSTSLRARESRLTKLLFVSHESYQQGVIGLVAGKLVEEFYRPSIVVSIGEKYSKASARSVAGFNIIEFIRSASHLLVDAGGHPMAAGFTVETTKLEILQKTFQDMAEKMLDENMLARTLRIDCEIPLKFVDFELYHEIQKLAPFGMGNPEPTFVSRNVMIENMRLVGNGGKHLKLNIKDQPFGFAQGESSKVKSFDAIAFGMGEKASEFHIGDAIDIAYVINEDTWPARNASISVAGGNGNNKLQLKIKDLRKPD